MGFITEAACPGTGSVFRQLQKNDTEGIAIEK